MIVTPDTKTTGEHWDEELGLYLDVDAAIQRWPFWWDESPEEYEKLQEKRKSAGVEIEDELFHVSDIEEPYDWDGDDDE